ncbi:MAG: NUDIX hydrolase N-terminal domain-containing protein [Chloroflexi bacterium]|nr:NUDIX hydrolase N-terminal domain-containing protein [Chloroflexota bacterium]
MGREQTQTNADQEFYQIADELRAIANLGLQFSDNEYHKERYTRALALSARLIAALDHRSPDDVLVQFQDNLGHVSPIAGAEAAVFRNDKLLLIRRRDNGLWALPGGLAEVGETLAQAAERELWEEANVRGRATQLLGVFDSRLWQITSKAQLNCFVFRVESEDSPSPRSETLDAKFFGEDELPTLSPGHRLRVPLVFKLNRGEICAPYFDKEN